MASLARAPADLQPRWWHLPRLAWVVARAFLGTRLPGRVAAVWAISPAAFVYLPLLVSAACRRHLAASPDHTAVVVVWTGLRDRLTLLAVGVLEIVAVIAVVDVGLDLTLALADVTTLTGLVVATLTLGTALTVILLPAMVEATVMLRYRFTPTSAPAETYTAQLRRTGHTAWIIGPWAAWPPGRHTGTALADHVLHEAPPDVWLVALARDTHIANALDARGFLTPHGGGLLRVRPPAGQTPPPASLTDADDPESLARHRQSIADFFMGRGEHPDQAEQIATAIQDLVIPQAPWNGRDVDSPVARAMCVDGPMAGEEFTIEIEPSGSPADVVDIHGHAYQLAIQPPPSGSRPWRYTALTEGSFLVQLT